MLQLCEGGARDHVLNVLPALVFPDATGLASGSQPQPSSVLFNSASECTIVNQLVTYDVNSTDACKCGGPDQHASASRSCSPPASLPYPAWRVEHEKEKNKCRYQRALGQGLAAQFHH